jgi:hypothetical protein
MQRLIAFLITFWAGSLWTICGVVAPGVFKALDDRHAAGQLAARFFHIESFVGLGIGALLLAIGAVSGSGVASSRIRILIVITMAMPLISQFVLGPVMERARAAGNMSRFGMLHGVAGGLFLIACVTALLLVWEVSRRAE